MDILWYLLGKKAGSLKLPVIPPEAGTLTSIVVGTLPDKTTYTEGEALDLTGLVILGNFSNGYQIDVTNGCTFVCNDPVTYYDTKITAKYVVLDTERTVDISITVNGVSPEAPAQTKGLWHFDDGTDKNEVNGKGTTTSGLTDPNAFSGSQQGAGKFDLGFKNTNYWCSYDNTLGLTNYTSGQLANAEFTVECWVMWTTTSGNNAFKILLGDTSGSSAYVYLSNYNGLKLANTNYIFPGGSMTTQTAVANHWYHLATVFHNGISTAYLDGVQIIQSTSSNFGSGAGLRYIKVTCDNSSTYCDEVLITESAKYLANFEPPHAPYHLAQGGE